MKDHNSVYWIIITSLDANAGKISIFLWNDEEIRKLKVDFELMKQSKKRITRDEMKHNEKTNEKL